MKKFVPLEEIIHCGACDPGLKEAQTTWYVRPGVRSRILETSNQTAQLLEFLGRYLLFWKLSAVFGDVYRGDILDIFFLAEKNFSIDFLLDLDSSECETSLSLCSKRKTFLQRGYGLIENMISASDSVINVYSKYTMNLTISFFLDSFWVRWTNTDQKETSQNQALEEHFSVRNTKEGVR